MSEPRSLQGEYAGFASRLVAFLIDTAILSAVALVTTWAAVSLLFFIGVDVWDCPPLGTGRPVQTWLCHGFLILEPLASVTFLIAYGLFFWTVTGQTPGKAIMGVRIVRLDGRPMTLLTSSRRVLGYVLSMLSLGFGFLVILADDRRQGWHDKLAGTCVIYAWKAREHGGLLERVGLLWGGRD